MAISQTNSCVRFPAANAQFAAPFKRALISLLCGYSTSSSSHSFPALQCELTVARLWSIFRLILLFADQLTCTSAAGAAIQSTHHPHQEGAVRGGRCKPSRVIKVALGHIRIHIPIPSFRHPYYPSCTSSMTATTATAAATTSAGTLSFILIGFLLDRTTRFHSWEEREACADRCGGYLSMRTQFVFVFGFFLLLCSFWLCVNFLPPAGLAPFLPVCVYLCSKFLLDVVSV